jgi:hypothetical protein
MIATPGRPTRRQTARLSELSHSDLVLWPEAAVHLDAAICPQLEHKPITDIVNVPAAF